MKIIIVSGEKDSGKTAFLRSLADGANCAGCLASKVFLEGRCIGYDLELLPGGGISSLVRESGTKSPERILRSVTGRDGKDLLSYGPFLFDRNVFRRACGFLTDNMNDSSLTRWILDEAGPLEMEGEGLAPFIERFLGPDNVFTGERELYLSVRPSLVEEVQDFFHFKADRVMLINS